MRALARHGSALLAGQLAAAALGFALAVVLARELGGEQFGRFALVVATVSIVANVFDVRVWEVSTRFATEHLGEDRPAEARTVLELALVVNFAFGLLATAVLVALSAPVADLLLGDSGLTGAVVVYAAIAPLLALQNAASVSFRIYERYDGLAVLTAFAAAIRLAAVVPPLLADAALETVLAALVLAELVATVAFLIVALRILSARAQVEGSLRRRVGDLRYQLVPMGRRLIPSNLTGTLRVINDRADVIVVGAMVSPAAAGVLALARTYVQPMVLLLRPIADVIYPAIARARAEHRLADAWELIRRSSRFAVGAFAVLAVALSLSAPWLVPALAGPEYADGWLTVLPLALGWFVLGSLFWVYPTALALDMQVRALVGLALATAVQFLILVLLAPGLGAPGAGVAYAVFALAWAAFVARPVRARIASVAEPGRSGRDGEALALSAAG